jgi:hypothetical protein
VAQDKVVSFEFELAETIKSLDDAEARTRNLLSLRKEWWGNPSVVDDALAK